jgi:gliding motility-associated-like protein
MKGELNSLIFLIIISSFFWNNGQSLAQHNEWTWMAGDNVINQTGVFGTQGVASPLNKPGAKYEGGEWVDLQGDFWHFAGGATNYINDLWKFNPLTTEWTWMKGTSLPAQVSNYGVLGVPNIANAPGYNALGCATCVDLEGNLWMFGGIGILGVQDDLWKYDPLLNMWTWVNGSQSISPEGIYGTQGVAAAANKPGARCETDAMWVDDLGNLWMFGGSGYDAFNNSSALNDLWKFDPITSQWTWMKGSNVGNQSGVYGTQGVASPSNTPGARTVYASWKDLSGNFWIFGGYNGSGEIYDDLWKYDPLTNMWTWVKGTNGSGNVNGSYGTQCLSSPTNNPPAAWENRARWEDDCGNFWFWGGYSNTAKIDNDLWRYSHATGNWSWISGSNSPNQTEVYGTQGVSNSTNMPGGRRGSIAFRRPFTNELWFFGGLAQNGAEFNDMWRFIPDKPTALFSISPDTGCIGNTVVFTNNSTPGCNEIKSSYWNFGDPASGANNTSLLDSPSHIYNAAGTYTIKLLVTNCTGSMDSISQTFVIDSSPIINVTPNSPVLCEGQATTLISSGAATYMWSPAIGLNDIIGNTVTASPEVTTSYTVAGISDNGCSDTTTVTVSVIAAPIANAGLDITIHAGSSAQLNATGGGVYLWSPAQGLGCTNCPDPTAAPLAPTTYCVEVTDDITGCSDTDCMKIDFECGDIYMPNAFSPNNDNLNDQQCVVINDDCIKSATLTIFDRWGEKVFESTDMELCWDGTYKGKQLSTAVFAYLLDATLTTGEKINKSGKITLVR